MSREIDIRLNTKYNGAGVDKAKKSLAGLGAAATKLGEVFGGSNSFLGQMVGFLAGGGLWQAAAAGVGFVVRKISELSTASERASKAMAAAAKEAHAEQMRSFDEYAAAVDKLAQKRVAAINQNLKALNEELEATKELTKAVLELEKAEARKRGDSGRMAEIDREMAGVETEAARSKLENEIAAAQRRQESGVKSLAEARVGRDRAVNEARWMEAVIADRIGAVVDEARKNAKGKMTVMPSSAGATYAYATATEVDRKAAGDLAAKRFMETQEYKDLNAQLEAARKKASDFGAKMQEAQTSIEESAAAEQNLSDKIAALDLREEARLANEEARLAEEAKRTEEKRITELKAAEIKAAAEAVKERERLEREAHKKRMDDIRAEIAASTGRGSLFRATAAAAQSEFDRAFAMYRDPAHAASVIGEEKAYQADLERLHRDANRYGGKWRIDELSRLMAAGDSQGVTDTLQSWRKSRSFTPEIEAMVRASAAEQTKTTAEEELRKIEHNTAGLSEKLDELLAMKG